LDHNGKVEAIGPPDDVIEIYRNWIQSEKKS